MPADLLVDTSVWIDVFRGALPTYEAPMAEHLRGRRVAVVGQVVAELLQGMRDERDRKALHERFAGLEWLETDQEAWLLAGELAAKGRFSGKVVNLADCLIAAVAKLNGCKVITRDSDFLRLKGVDVELL